MHDKGVIPMESWEENGETDRRGKRTCMVSSKGRIASRSGKN